MYIFIFRRDLRIVDNVGFNWLVEQGYEILPIFIMNPQQIDVDNNRFFSHKSVQFMQESLKDLDMAIKKAGGNVSGLAFLMELSFLNGNEKLKNEEIMSLLRENGLKNK